MTVLSDSDLVGEMERKVETFPWETTALGPIKGWSQALKTALSICLGSATPVSHKNIPVACLWIAAMIRAGLSKRVFEVFATL